MFTQHTALAHSLYIDQAPRRPDRDYTTQRDARVAPQTTHCTPPQHLLGMSTEIKKFALSVLGGNKNTNYNIKFCSLDHTESQVCGKSSSYLHTCWIQVMNSRKQLFFYCVWIMVPYNSENQDRFAHYNNDKYVVWLANNNKIDVALLPNNTTNGGGFAPK